MLPVVGAEISGGIDADQQADADDREGDEDADLVDDDAEHRGLADVERSTVSAGAPAVRKT